MGTALPSPARIGYVDRHGRRIDRTIWRALSARPEYVVIASDVVGCAGHRVQIMTIWLGLYLPVDPPPIFETLLQPIGSARPRAWTWSCLAQARTGHRTVVGELSAEQ
ncbi:hypothetical protein [Kribbella sp. NPDC004536]|uniref:hypothetical protein n=1 Tax=Kribbella sp. NPDC004536 TaxID=3364106 RepID=UPI0036997374